MVKFNGLSCSTNHQFLFSFIFSTTVTLLKLTNQLIALAFDNVQIVVCQLTPFFFGSTFKLLPFSFDNIFIHSYIILSY